MKPTKITLPAFILLSLSITPVILGQSKCAPPHEGETTHWEGNMHITQTEDKPIRELFGVVAVGYKDRLNGALVEVFTHPEDMPEFQADTAESKQSRVAACRTGRNGKFWFRNLPPGKYEVRLSYESRSTYDARLMEAIFDVTSVIVQIDPKKGQRSQIFVWMQVAN